MGEVILLYYTFRHTHKQLFYCNVTTQDMKLFNSDTNHFAAAATVTLQASIVPTATLWIQTN